jgi:hypothetical protein
MAYEIPGQMVSFQAAADLSAYQFRFVKLDANGQVALCSAVTDIPIGVLQDKPGAQGRACNVMLDGITKIVGGANLAKGDQVGTDTTGRAVAYVAGTDTTKYPVGQILEDNSVAGGLCTMVFDAKKAARGA